MRDTGDGYAAGDLASAASTAEWQMEVRAAPENLPEVRRELAAWVARAGASAEQVEVVELATYEALANAAIHAYGDSVGTVQVHGERLPGPPRIEITVRDHGKWRDPPAHRDGTGGRGLVLIRSLTTATDLDAGRHGTTVSMCWNLHAGESEQRPPAC